jgi:hypothetical protein
MLLTNLVGRALACSMTALNQKNVWTTRNKGMSVTRRRQLARVTESDDVALKGRRQMPRPPGQGWPLKSRESRSNVTVNSFV